MLRLTASLVLAAGCVAFVAYLHELGEFPTASPAARHLRLMKDRVAVPDSAEPTTYAAMASMPDHAPLARYAPLEQRAVELEGHVQRLLRAADDDFHIELAAEPRQPGDPNLRYVTAEITPAWRLGSANWSYAHLVQAFHPTFGGVTAWDGGTHRVRLTGWLLYDYEYQDVPVYGRPRIASWELHPVTRIELWNDSLGTYVDLPR